MTRAPIRKYAGGPAAQSKLRAVIICKRRVRSLLQLLLRQQAASQPHTDLRALIVVQRSLAPDGAPALQRCRWAAKQPEGAVQRPPMGVATRVWFPWNAAPDVCSSSR